MRLDFVINPHAGHVEAGPIAEALRTRFSGWATSFSSTPREVPPPGPEQRMVVAVGGDGTVSGVLNGGIPGLQNLGILPMGTANDFAAGLGIPSDFVGACNVLAKQMIGHVDTIRVNQWRIATCGGIGFAVDVAQLANRWKESRARPLLRWIGPLVYPLATMRRLLGKGRSIEARVTAEGITQVVHLSTAMVSNQPFFGGRFSTSPKASNTDGKLDLCLIRQPGSALDLTRIATRIYQARPDRCVEATQLQTDELKLAMDTEVPFFGDGELLGSARDFQMKAEPGALRVAMAGS
jgi:diacylglycerol kinase (ATP)